MSHIEVFKEIFKECSVFSKKIFDILNDHKNMKKIRKMDGEKGSNKRPRKGKRPLTSYMCFVREVRSTVVEKHPNATFPEIGRILGKIWATLDDQQKQKYEEMAREDKLRHQQEQQIHEEEEEEREGESEVVLEEKPKKRKKKKRKKQRPSE